MAALGTALRCETDRDKRDRFATTVAVHLVRCAFEAVGDPQASLEEDEQDRIVLPRDAALGLLMEAEGVP